MRDHTGAPPDLMMEFKSDFILIITRYIVEFFEVITKQLGLAYTVGACPADGSTASQPCAIAAPTQRSPWPPVPRPWCKWRCG